MKDDTHVNLNVSKELRDKIKRLAKQVHRRTMKAYLQELINGEIAKLNKEELTK